MKGVLIFAGVNSLILCRRTSLVGLLLALSAIFPVMAENLSFTVTATVVESSCSVVPEDVNQTITMGEVDVAKLESGQSDITFFNIRLVGCENATATINFSSQFPNGGGWFYPFGGQTWGYVLGFTNEQGVPIPLGLDKKISLNGANNTLKFGVIAEKTSGSLRMGDFYAVATATISYQ